jgi:hypothetical protein
MSRRGNISRRAILIGASAAASGAVFPMPAVAQSRTIKLGLCQAPFGPLGSFRRGR